MKIVRIQEYEVFVSTVAEWLYDEWIKDMPDGSVSLAECILLTKPDHSGLPIVFIAVRDNEPVGVARLTKHDMDTRQALSPWLASVFVPLQHRKCGIGTALCKSVVSSANKLGFARLFLYTPNRESFYFRQGWQSIETTFYRNEKVVVMQIEPSGT